MHSIFTHLLIAVGILFSSASFSQTVTQSWYQLWATSYLGPTAGGCRVIAIAVDASGNAIVSGSGDDPGGRGAIVTAKFTFGHPAVGYSNARGNSIQFG